MRTHPNDQLLQRARSRRLNESEELQVRKHLENCSRCRQRVYEYTQLESLLAASERGFASEVNVADAVLERIKRETDASRLPLNRGKPIRNVQETPAPRRLLAHAAVATVATYLFLASGLVNMLFTADSESMPLDLVDGTCKLVGWIEQWSHSLPS